MTSTMTPPAGKIARPGFLPLETVLLAFVCTLDAVSTLYLVSTGRAVEANPALAWTFDYGSFMFLAVKLLSFVPAIVILERIRDRKPRLVKVATRAALAGYLAIYLFGTLHLHGGLPALP